MFNVLYNLIKEKFNIVFSSIYNNKSLNKIYIYFNYLSFKNFKKYFFILYTYFFNKKKTISLKLKFFTKQIIFFKQKTSTDIKVTLIKFKNKLNLIKVKFYNCCICFFNKIKTNFSLIYIYVISIVKVVNYIIPPIIFFLKKTYILICFFIQIGTYCFYIVRMFWNLFIFIYSWVKYIIKSILSFFYQNTIHLVFVFLKKELKNEWSKVTFIYSVLKNKIILFFKPFNLAFFESKYAFYFNDVKRIIRNFFLKYNAEQDAALQDFINNTSQDKKKFLDFVKYFSSFL